jgi:hypothetical protein
MCSLGSAFSLLYNNDSKDKNPRAGRAGAAADSCPGMETIRGFALNTSTSSSSNTTEGEAGRCEDPALVDYTSVGVLLTGIILARYHTVYS